MKSNKLVKALVMAAPIALANWVVIIAVAVVLPVAVILIVAALNGSITIPPGARVTLPAVATQPKPATAPVVLAAAAVPDAPMGGGVAQSVSTDPPLLMIRTSEPGRLMMIATKRGVVQRCVGDGGWEFFDFVNRVPWYWDLENDGEACVMFRLVEAD